MSRGVVTILVTDQVGSTEMLARLGEDEADRVRRSHFLLLREAVAVAGGREVKHLGDGVMVAFATPTDAVTCAVAIQQAVERQSRRAGEVPVAVRIGIDVGESSVEEGDYFGTSVVVANRLCQVAGGGQVLVSDLVRRLMGSRGGFDFGPAVELRLKGLPDPVPACEVRWAPLPGSPFALPPELSPPGVTPFVGREHELRRLRASWARAREGRPSLVVVTGEAGIGKTRLAQELAASVATEGATVVFGRCEEETLSPHALFAEPLRQYVLACPVEQLAGEAAGIAEELCHVVPELSRRVPPSPGGPGLEPDADRHRLFDAVATLLRRASATAPLLVVLDDLQWAEKPALVLLRHVVRRLEHAPVLVLATCRDVEASRSQPLLDMVGDLRRERLAETVALSGLVEDDVGALLGELAGRPSTPVFVRTVLRATEGNPFFVESLVRHLDETGTSPPVEGRAADLDFERLGLPEDVKEVIGRRLSVLTDQCNRVLSMAAVIGRTFHLGVLQRVSGLRDDELLEVVEEAVRARVMVESSEAVDQYAFAHALIREVLYEGLIGSRRVRLHRRVGDALEQLYGDDRDEHLAELALHFLAAGTDGDEDKAVSYALGAAERALAVLAYEEAAVLCERALRSLEGRRRPEERQRLDALLLLGTAHCRSGASAEARKAFAVAADAARSSGSAEALTRVAMAYGQVPVEYGLVDERLVAVLDEALTSLPPDGSALRVCLLSRLAEELYYTHRRNRCLPLAREALEMARRLGERAALVEALRVRRLTLFGPGSVQRRVDMSNELVRIAEEAGDLQASLRGRIARFVDVVESGDVAAVDAEIERIAGLAEDLRQPSYFWYPAKWKAMRALMEGRFDEGERLAEAALATGQRAHGESAFQAYIVQLIEVRRCQGRLHELEGTLEAGAEQYRAVPAWRCGLAWLYTELGRHDEARRELDLLAAHDFADLPEDLNWLTSVAVLSEVCARVGDGARAAILHELLVPYAGQCVCLGSADVLAGSVDRFVGLAGMAAGRFDDADAAFRAALDGYRAMGVRPDEARTELDHARLFLARRGAGDEARAARAVERCLAVSEALGMGALAEQARSL